MFWFSSVRFSSVRFGSVLLGVDGSNSGCLIQKGAKLDLVSNSAPVTRVGSTSFNLRPLFWTPPGGDFPCHLGHNKPESHPPSPRPSQNGQQSPQTSSLRRPLAYVDTPGGCLGVGRGAADGGVLGLVVLHHELLQRLAPLRPVRVQPPCCFLPLSVVAR